MYCVIYYTGGTGQTALVIYGPFSSSAAAQAFINGQANPTLFSISNVYNPPPYAQGSGPTSQSVSAGSYVVARAPAQLTMPSQIYLYGPFTTQAAASAFIAGQVPTIPYQVCTVHAGS